MYKATLSVRDKTRNYLLQSKLRFSEHQTICLLVFTSQLCLVMLQVPAVAVLHD